MQMLIEVIKVKNPLKLYFDRYFTPVFMRRRKTVSQKQLLMLFITDTVAILWLLITTLGIRSKLSGYNKTSVLICKC